MNHKLDLLGNAMDSLEEALKKFEEGDAGDQKAYKFCVLHMAHFIELIFKHHITEKHPLLIYANPFAPKIDPATAKTIGLWEAVNFINNEDKDAVSGDFKKDLDWLKRLRNDIEHHKFEMDVATARITIGRLFPRSDRAPFIAPVAADRLCQLIQQAPGLADFSIGRTLRISSGFYTSQALELVRTA